MIQIIAGEKGKGKTKILLEKVATEVKTTSGNVVYLDKNTKHMYELTNKVRLINVRDYLVENFHEFLGFICGILSQDHDLEKVYLDSFLKIACVEAAELQHLLDKLNKISQAFGVDFILSISTSKEQIPEDYKKDIIVAL
ncbi:MAG: twitching motility protein PilT [Velocimicrobium sp.]